MIGDGVGDGGYPISGDPFLTKTLLLSLYSILCWYQPSGFCESPIFEGVVLPHFFFSLGLGVGLVSHENQF